MTVDERGRRLTESRDRLDRLRAALDRRGASAALLGYRRNFAWLTAGGEGHIVLSTEGAVVSLLVTRDEVVALTENIEAARIAEEELAGLEIETVAVPWWEKGSILREAERRVGSTPLDDDDLEDDLVPLRTVLSPFDRRRLEQLGRIGREAVEGALADLTPGMTEHELAASLVGRLTGVQGPVVLAAADDRIARYRHPLPTSRPIRRRVMLVLVGERWGLHVALTRIKELDEPSTDLAARIAAVARVERAVQDATRPGVTLGSVFEAARTAYGHAGFPDEWRDHHQGGTIAYQGRETIVRPDDPTPIEPGMAFAWNPSIAGAKAEDTFYLDEDGERRLVTRG
jgi:Xaa-Pro aminopeptidase